jgi:hypothetical protein
MPVPKHLGKPVQMKARQNAWQDLARTAPPHMQAVPPALRKESTVAIVPHTALETAQNTALETVQNTALRNMRITTPPHAM